MNNSMREITFALCMNSSEKKSFVKPLSNAEFYALNEAIAFYNGADDTLMQMDLFNQGVENPNRFNFTYLCDVDALFLSRELKLKGDLPNRIVSLLARRNSLAFEIEKLEGIAVHACTVFDDEYPKKLKDGLSAMPHSLREPPILYFCGELSLAGLEYAGFVGSRDVNEDDVAWVCETIKKIYNKAERDNKIMGIVSGGAEGTDKVSQDAAIKLVMPVIEYSKNMRASLKNETYLNAIIDERMLLLSEVNPLRTLSRPEATAHFMNRNKYIYATAKYTIVVKSAVGAKSGTWAGASEALKRKIGKVFVRDANYAGNVDLIKMGASTLP